MNFFSNLFTNPSEGFLKISLIIIFANIFLLLIAYYYELIYKKKLLKKMDAYELSLKDLVEEFRSFELLLVEQKKVLDEYKYNFQRTEQEISRLADSHSSDENITTAINLAKEGLNANEISTKTGLPLEEIEPIIKYHGRQS